MSTSIYIDNVLREQWDDDTRTYTQYDAQGQIVGQPRPYTDAENHTADAVAAAEERSANERALRDGLANVLTRAAGYQADAQTIIDETNSAINSNAAARIKMLARAQKRAAGDIMRLARLAGGLLDSADTGSD